jgi:glyoxylase-like metal-dependent hydrolase (beta-lactamase superfamily II)
VAHAKAIGHLISPEKLWLGTVKVMGEVAEVYGRPEGLDPARLIPHDTFNEPKIRILETPGHAAHHLSYGLGETMFLGEAVGCPYHFGSSFHSRPATPPRFYPRIALATLEKLLKERPIDAYFAHTHEKGPLKETILAYQSQLKLWDEILYPAWRVESATVKPKELLNKLTDRLFEVDPELRPLLTLGEEALKVEKYFMGNSVAGFLEYYEETKAKKVDRGGRK